MNQNMRELFAMIGGISVGVNTSVLLFGNIPAPLPFAGLVAGILGLIILAITKK